MDAGGHRNDGGERRHEVRYKVVSDHQVRFAEIELGGDEKDLLIPTGKPEVNSGVERTPNDRDAKRGPWGTGELTLEDLNFWEEKAQAGQITGDGTANAPDGAEDMRKPSVGAYRNEGTRATVRTDAGDSGPMIGASHADLFDAAHSTATNKDKETMPSSTSADRSSHAFHEFGEADDKLHDPVSPESSLPPSRVAPYDGVRYYSREQQFVLRARELAWHVEPEAPIVPFKSYWPTYDHMSSAQVKWYFYWREEVRSGRYPDTDLSYLFLYIYELINGIGWTYPEQGWQLMDGVRNAYRERYPKLDAYMREWLFDFSLAHGLDKPITETYDKIPRSLSSELRELEWLRRFKAEPLELNWDVLTDLLDYEPDKSRFYREGGRKDMKTYVPKVVAMVDAYLGKKKGCRLLDRFNPPEIHSERYIFRSAVYDYGLYGRTVSLPLQRISSHAPLRAYVTQLARLTENKLRELRGFKGRLKGVDVEPEIAKLTARFLKKELALADGGKKAPKPEIRIDAGKLRRLRQESDEVRDMLIVAEQSDGLGNGAVRPLAKARKNETGPGNKPGKGKKALWHPDEPMQVTMDFETGFRDETFQEAAWGEPNPDTVGTGDPAAILTIHEAGIDFSGTESFNQAVSADSEDSLDSSDLAASEEYMPPSSEERPFLLLDDEWQELAERLTETHFEVLFALKHGPDVAALQAAADRAGSMPELLIDEINEVAMETIGDLLVDGDAVACEYKAMLDLIKR